MMTVALGVAWRNLRTTARTPSLFVPPLAIPVFSIATFAGGLSALTRARGFDFSDDYTGFIFVFALVQASLMCGQFSGVALARDFETRFARRLLVTSPRRSGIVVGYAISAPIRAIATAMILFVIGVAVGMDVGGNAAHLLGLLGLAIVLSLIGAAWTMGVALRLRSAQAAPAMMLPIFIGLFASPVFVPLDAITGWLHAVATANPLTPLVESGRSLLRGGTDDVGLALLIVAGMLPALALWTATGLRRAVASGG